MRREPRPGSSSNGAVSLRPRPQPAASDDSTSTSVMERAAGRLVVTGRRRCNVHAANAARPSLQVEVERAHQRTAEQLTGAVVNGETDRRDLPFAQVELPDLTFEGEPDQRQRQAVLCDHRPDDLLDGCP